MPSSDPEYLPAFADQIPPHLDGRRADPLGGLNCTCYAGEMAADYHTRGRIVPEAARIRRLTGDTVGGTNLTQIDNVLRITYTVDLDTRFFYPWSSFMDRIRAGQGAILQGGYRPLRESRFSGSETFGANHAIPVFPKLIPLDSLCDGRRAGLYDARRHERYPEDLLHEFASKLQLGTGFDDRPILLGPNRVYASFTADQRNTFYRVAFKPGPFRVFRLIRGRDGVVRAQALSRRRRFRRSTAAICTRPRRYALHGAWLDGRLETRSLVRIEGGSLRGLWVAPKAGTNVELREIIQ
jgi:hypothetical protein